MHFSDGLQFRFVNTFEALFNGVRPTCSTQLPPSTVHLVLHPSTLPLNPLEHICGRDLRRPDKEGLPRSGGASRPRGLQVVQGEDVLTGTGETQNPSCYLGTSIHTGLLHTLGFGEFTGAPLSNQRLPPDFSLPCSAMPPAPPGPEALFA